MILLSAYRIRKYWLLLMGLVGQKTGGKGGKKEHSEDKTILKVTITKHSLFMSTKDCPGETNQYQRLHSFLCNTPQRCHPTESLHIQPKHHPSIRTDTTITVCCAAQQSCRHHTQLPYVNQSILWYQHAWTRTPYNVDKRYTHSRATRASKDPPKGGRGCLMSPPCLESQGCHLIPLCYLLLFFCLVLLPFLSYRFLPAGPFFSTFSRKFFNIFR